jgi:hypothetical protein
LWSSSNPLLELPSQQEAEKVGMVGVGGRRKRRLFFNHDVPDFSLQHVFLASDCSEADVAVADAETDIWSKTSGSASTDRISSSRSFLDIGLGSAIAVSANSSSKVGGVSICKLKSVER